VNICSKIVTFALSVAYLASTAYGAEEVKRPRHRSTKADVAASPAPAAQPKPKVVRTESLSYDNWTVNCAYTDRPGDKPRCSAILRIAEKVNNVPRIIFTWIMGEQKSKLVSVLSMPTGVLIEPGVEVKIGAGAAKKYSYSLCAPDHCEAIIPMDAAIASEMKRAQTTEATVVGLRGQSVKFTVNMKGFGQALAAVAK